MSLRNRNRYTRLVSRIRRDFEKFRTETHTISANDRVLISNADDDEWAGDNEPFANFAPWNSVSVENDGSTTVRVYLDRDRTVFFDVDAGESRRLEIPMYFAYMSIAEQGGTDADVTVTYGRMVDSRELRLMEMGGMLNLEG